MCYDLIIGLWPNDTSLVSGSALAAGLAALIHDSRPDASALPLRSWLKLVPFVGNTFWLIDVNSV